MTTPKKAPTATAEDYHSQLKDPLWLDKRDSILERDNHTCRACGATDSLQVHHSLYEYGKKAWEYPDFWLITLCNSCHKSVHNDLSDLKMSLDILKRDHSATDKIALASKAVWMIMADSEHSQTIMRNAIKSALYVDDCVSAVTCLEAELEGAK